jgi:hypothetical protein
MIFTSVNPHDSADANTIVGPVIDDGARSAALALGAG